MLVANNKTKPNVNVTTCVGRGILLNVACVLSLPCIILFMSVHGQCIYADWFSLSFTTPRMIVDYPGKVSSACYVYAVCF